MHPSTRAGIFACGHGLCQSGTQKTSLEPRLLFYIARDTEYQFSTQDSSLDVITFHPDSDWGPTHAHHPMINRTWVSEKHQVTEVIQG